MADYLEKLAGEKGFERMPGSEPNHWFLVICKKNSLKLGIRPLIFPFQGHLYFGFRMRVEADNPNGSPKLAKQVFDLPFRMKEGNVHASFVAGIPAQEFPCIPLMVKEQWDKQSGTEKLVAGIVKKIGNGVDWVVTPEQILQFMQSQYDDELPEITLKEIESFDIKVVT